MLALPRCFVSVVEFPATLYHTMAVESRKSPKKARKSAGEALCTTGQADEYATFSAALKKVLTVSHKEMQKRITRASASRALDAKD
jgi:hypothetical protein